MNASNQSHQRVEQIFTGALQIASQAQRQAFLEQECSDDAALRREVEQLLKVEQNPDSFLNHAALDDFPCTESIRQVNGATVGETIGTYKLLQKLGEGGMGTVFLAEQTEPIRRRVAIKLVKEGMDSKQFIARFEAERQALAMMDHPNIAQVFDAGCTGDGRPYFVMELVKGIPITQFCDDNKLTTQQRLELFLPVCQAVQHAHQKGIIHRDLKPSNVLVAMYDDQPVPKVIDFGVAKATNQRLTEKTLFTMIGQIVGTWEYMSPEQAVLNQLDVDTRSDIYSLGVILYELLTGVPPIDGNRLRTAGLEETLRLIREEEPPKPSSRVSSLGQAANATAGYRRTDKHVLFNSLRGDLDWIVMKALDKDRTRRYQTPLGLFADINRHMSDEPVEARAPSSLYRIRKYVRRHRGLVASISAIFLVMTAGLIMTSAATNEANRQRENAIEQRRLADEQRRSADEQREIAEQKRIEAEKSVALVKEYTYMLSMSGSLSDVERAIAVAKMVMRDGPERDVWLLMLNAQGALHRQADQCIAYLNEGLEISPGSISCKALLASTYILTGDWNEAADLMEELRSVEPQNAEDYAFLAQAFITEPEKCLDYAKRSLAIRDSLVARLAHAEATVFRAMDSGDDSNLQEALGAIDSVEGRVGDNPYVWVISLLAETAIIQFAERRGEDTSEMRARAEQTVQRLRNVPQFNIGRMMIAYHMNACGSTEQRTAAWEQVIQTDSRGGLYQATPHFMSKEASPGASEWLRYDDVYSQACHLLLRLGEPQGVERLLSFYESKTKDRDIDHWLPLDFMLVLPAGDPQYIKRDARTKLTAVDNDEVECRTPMDRYTLEILAGDISEDEFVNHARGSNVLKSHCYRVLGDLSLAKGDRKSAKEHYERVVELGVFHGGDYCWSSAYLRNMDADETWPHWIDSDQHTRTSK